MVDFDYVNGGYGLDGEYDCEDGGWSPAMYEGPSKLPKYYRPAPKPTIVCMMDHRFTDRQNFLLGYLIRKGMGYAKFAESVRSSGKCSQKQEVTMENMYTRCESWDKTPAPGSAAGYAMLLKRLEEHDY